MKVYTHKYFFCLNCATFFKLNFSLKDECEKFNCMQ